MSSEWTRKQLRQEVERLRMVADIGERSKALLLFIERSITAKASTFSAHQAGIALFGRGPEHDPNDDPVVRIELARLAAALERHYSIEPADRVRLSLRSELGKVALELQPNASPVRSTFRND